MYLQGLHPTRLCTVKKGTAGVASRVARTHSKGTWPCLEAEAARMAAQAVRS